MKRPSPVLIGTKTIRRIRYEHDYCINMNEDNSSWGPFNTPSVNFRNTLTPVFDEMGGPRTIY